MTVEKCATACAGYKYFGLEYGRECFCGNTINSDSVETPIGDCSFPCPGNPSQKCGAGNRLNMYSCSVTATQPLLTTYSTRGCYVEPQNGRALASLSTRADDMTVEKCATFCGTAGYPLFGLEYYTECYCGHGLATGAVSAPATDCKFACAGNQNQLCGGDWRLNVYEFDKAGAASTTSPTATSSPSAGPVTFTSEGCYTEARGVRALSNASYFNNAMTVELCASVCSNYAWFGVEYGRECYCGNTINTSSGSAPTSLSECSFPCPGNPSQKCGAGDRLNMYRNIPTQASTITSSSSATAVTTSAIILVVRTMLDFFGP
ncbi:WSC domain-containing protein-like protein 5 [Colletotrichum truncatum]|uniref:WSC domain-containing protein-like protein 5 n=1 Tax=Colletotrichum truncatum TaxID=5467 RepID=A0ACC3YDK8_COLTU|nr:WSC domain-containing protein-like protein 5 [Colletotrichum truncatum]KAF6783043.1 WSC domain-containing protein-like protein 5 [Colletotrichum truncatum]